MKTESPQSPPWMPRSRIVEGVSAWHLKGVENAAVSVGERTHRGVPGGDEAFRLLFERYQGRSLRLHYLLVRNRSAAEELTQETS